VRGRCEAGAARARDADAQAGADRVSVRNVVPTLTSNKRQGLSLNGRC
jgi:hypothetical protein